MEIRLVEFGPAGGVKWLWPSRSSNDRGSGELQLMEWHSISIVGGREPAEVGHSLEVPDDDGWFHAMEVWHNTRLLGKMEGRA
jgi:hypothetical protein